MNNPWEVVPSSSLIPPIKIGAGTTLAPYPGDKPAAQTMAIGIGTTAAPNTTYGPILQISRTLQIPELDFTGDGDGGLSAGRFTSEATEGSEGQAIGVVGGAITRSSYKGEHSLADAIGGYFVGRSEGTSTRTGQGVFALGERNEPLGIATGMEVVSMNNTATAGVYNTESASNTKCINMHPHGTSAVACGLQLTRIVATEPQLLVGIGINKSVVKESTFQDWSEGEYSIDIRKPHSKAAICIQPGAGQFVIGAGEAASATPYMELFTNEATVDPVLDIGSGKAAGTATSLRVRNVTGSAKLFVSNSANGFVKGSGVGGTGIAFSGGSFFIGTAGSAIVPSIAVSSEKLGFLGAAPVVRAAEIGAVAETAPALASYGFTEAQAKEILSKLNKVITAIKAIGITS